MTASTNDYVNLLTGEHRDKPKLVAVVEALTAGPVDLINAEYAFTSDFDLDSAVGVQLDQVGLWIGVGRTLQAPLPNTYFSFDTLGLGWDEGVWYEEGVPDSGVVVLPDEDYRTLLKARIKANRWDGTLPTLIEILQSIFVGSLTYVYAVDNQDMSMTILLAGALPTPIQLALLQGGYLIPKPMGVRVGYYTTSVDGDALFGWDVENSYIQGWDSGAWGLET